MIGKNPLTAAGDKFGNNSSKAQGLVGWLTAWFCDKGMTVYRPPFDAWDPDVAREAQATILEVYPGAAMLAAGFQSVSWPSSRPILTVNLGDTDQADARRCALVAACYDEMLGLGPEIGLPRVYDCAPALLPTGYDAQAIAREGWIFTPEV